MEADKQEGDKKELWTDEGHNWAGQAQARHQHTPAQASDAEFWRRMDRMFDVEMTKMEVGFAAALNQGEQSLGNRTEQESGVLLREMQATNHRIDDVMKRIEVLELRDRASPSRRVAAAQGHGSLST